MPGASSSGQRVVAQRQAEDRRRRDQPAVGRFAGRLRSAQPDDEHRQQQPDEEEVQRVRIGAQRDRPGARRDGQGQAGGGAGDGRRVSIVTVPATSPTAPATSSADSRLARSAGSPIGWSTTEASQASSV
jgi:hypothetical protein